MPTVSWWRTTFGGQEVLQRLADSIANGHLSQGPITAEFEARIAEALDVPYVVATTSGSVALLMALMALGIQRDDEVIVPNRTWIATAHAPLMLGAKTVLVDVQPDLPIMDVSHVEQKITRRTKAIMPVHLGGRAVDMEGVWEIAREYGLVVIEDAAQAMFSKNAQVKYLGTHSDAGCFSLSVAKLISTGQGGFVVTRSKETYERLKLIRTHGVSDVTNVSYTRMGFNFRFNDVLASIGIAQLDRVPKRIDHLKGVYAKYKAGIEDLPFLRLIPVAVAIGHVPLYVEVMCNERKRLIDFLASQGIQTRPFYPDLNLADYFGDVGEYPNSRVFGEQGLFLPCGPEQPLDNVDHVLGILRLCHKKGAINR